MTQPYSPEPQGRPAEFGDPQPTVPAAFVPGTQPGWRDTAIPANVGAQTLQLHSNPEYPPLPPTAPQVMGTTSPAPNRPSRTPIIVLAVLFVVALAAGSAMLIGYLDERGTNAHLTQQLDERQRSLTATNQKLTDANQRLATANGHIDQLDTQINNLTNQVNTLTTNNSGLNTCVTAIKTFFDSLNQNPNAPGLLQLARNADSVCGF